MLRYKCNECEVIFTGLETECPLCGSKRIVIIPDKKGLRFMAKYLHYFVRQRGVKHEALCDSRSVRSDMTTKKVRKSYMSTLPPNYKISKKGVTVYE